MEGDAKRVIREWNREIEQEIRAESRHGDGRWKIVVWIALEVLWLLVLLAVFGLFSRAPW